MDITHMWKGDISTMIYCLPVELAETTVSKPLKRGRTFKKMSNGYDANGVRVTNIIGFRKGDFLKVCPCCGNSFPASAFGLRYDSRNAKMRDQSYCSACRSRRVYDR